MAAPAAAALLRGATALRHVRLCRCEGGEPAATGGPSVVAALAALPGLASAAVEFCAPHADASAEVLAWRCARRDVRITVVADA